MSTSSAESPEAWLRITLDATSATVAKRLAALAAAPDALARWDGILRAWAKTTRFDAFPSWAQQAGGLPEALLTQVQQALAAPDTVAFWTRHPRRGEPTAPLSPSQLAWLTLGASGMAEADRLAHPLHQAALTALVTDLQQASEIRRGKAAPDGTPALARSLWEPTGLAIRDIIALVRAFPSQVPPDVEDVALARVVPRKVPHALLEGFEFQDFASSWNHRGENRLSPPVMATLRWLTRGSAAAQQVVRQRVDAHLTPHPSTGRWASSVTHTELEAQLVELRLRLTPPDEALPAAVAEATTPERLERMLSAFGWNAGAHRQVGLFAGLLHHPALLQAALQAERTAAAARKNPRWRGAVTQVLDDFDRDLLANPDRRLSLGVVPPQGLAFLLKHPEWKGLQAEGLRQLGLASPVAPPGRRTPPRAERPRPQPPGR